MNILILTGSPRPDGNTDLLVNAFAKGATQNNDVEIVNVRDYNVHPCVGCNLCFSNESHACHQQDDMSIIYGKLSQTDMLVIASPLYFYGLSAQLKTVIDRLHNPIRNTFHIKKMALLLVAAGSIPTQFDSIISQYQHCLNYFKMEDAGKILVNHVNDRGSIAGNAALSEAERLGASLQTL